MGTNFEIIYKHETIPDTEVNALTFVDDGAGVYKATVKLTISGTYGLWIRFAGLEVPTPLPAGTKGGMLITVSPAAATHAPSSNFSGVAASYLTGESVLITIEARDEFRNLRTTSTDSF
jgi:hypothetical protein